MQGRKTQCTFDHYDVFVRKQSETDKAFVKLILYVLYVE